MPRVKRRERGPGGHLPVISPDETVYRFSAKAPTKRLGPNSRRSAGSRHKKARKKAGYRVPSQRLKTNRDNRTYVFRNDQQDFPLQTDIPLTTPDSPHEGGGHSDFPAVNSLVQSEVDGMAFGNNSAITPDMLATIPEIDPSGAPVPSEPPAKPARKNSSIKGRRPVVERQTFVSSRPEHNMAADSYSFPSDLMSSYGIQPTSEALSPMEMLAAPIGGEAPLSPAMGLEKNAQPMANLPAGLDPNDNGLTASSPVISASNAPAAANTSSQGWVRPGHPGLTGIPGLGGTPDSASQPANIASAPGNGKVLPASSTSSTAVTGASPMGMGGGMSPMGMGGGMSPMGMGSGMSPMGMSSGMSPMGMSSGMSPMGMSSGMSPMGMSSGMSPMGMGGGMSPMGMSSGMSPMGMSNRMPPMGMMGSGMSPMGMGGGMSPMGMSSGMSPLGMSNRMSPMGMGGGMSPMGMGGGMSPMGMGGGMSPMGMGGGMSPMGMMGSGMSPMGMMGRSYANGLSPLGGYGGDRR